jgi:hypothetical protein
MASVLAFFSFRLVDLVFIFFYFRLRSTQFHFSLLSIIVIAPSDEKPALLLAAGEDSKANQFVSTTATSSSAQKNRFVGDGDKSPPISSSTTSASASLAPQRYFSAYASFSQFLDFFDYQQQQQLLGVALSSNKASHARAANATDLAVCYRSLV